MKLFRFFVVAIAVTVLLAVLVGCASPRRAATARISISSGTNSVEITQPKDTAVKRLRWEPGTGFFEIEDYASAANAGVIAAESAHAQAQAATFDRAIEFGRSMGFLAARAYGVPTGDLQPGMMQASPSTVWNIPEAPDGWKWTLGTNGVPKLAPKDDPSTPKHEATP